VKVVLFGATDMVGQGVPRECLLDPDVESVLAVVRNASLPEHDKLREIRRQLRLSERGRLRWAADAIPLRKANPGLCACIISPLDVITYGGGQASGSFSCS
jgi:hypothetical protein